MKRLERFRAERLKGDDGVVIVLVALMLIFFLITTAIVVDLGNARQQKRQAVSAADAGALAGAQALASNTHPPLAKTTPATPGCTDIKCTAAYYTLASVDLTPNMATFTSTSCGASCVQYSVGKATVKVTNPYAVGSSDSSKNVNVNVCWDSNTAFARVIGVSTVNVCGSATAQTTGANNGSSGITEDCVAEDNFADQADKSRIYVFNPGDYPNEGGTFNPAKAVPAAKNNEDLVVEYDGNGTDIDLSSIDFEAPTTASGTQNPPSATNNNVRLSRVTPQDNKGPESGNAHGIGYVVQSLDAAGKVQPYTTGGTFKVLISYQLPDDAHLKVGGKSFTYTATLHANDSVGNPAAPAAPTHCGNAAWTFTHDGKNIANGGSTCGENSFFGFPPEPADGASVVVGQTLKVFYTDESVIQDADVNVTNGAGKAADPQFGIDFSFVATGSGNDPTPVPPKTTATPTGYTLTSPGDHIKDKFNTTIAWVVPSTLAGGNYTISLKAYDTDNNSAGNDCGVVTWKIKVGGGAVRLVE